MRRPARSAWPAWHHWHLGHLARAAGVGLWWVIDLWRRLVCLVPSGEAGKVANANGYYPIQRAYIQYYNSMIQYVDPLKKSV